MASNESNAEGDQELLDALEGLSPGDELHDTGREGLRQRLSGLLSSVESKRDSSRLVDLAYRAADRNRQIPATLLAGALASRLVIYAIPFIVLEIVTTGAYSQMAGADAVEAARAAGMPGLLAEAAEDSKTLSEGFRIGTVLVMLVATVWAAGSLGRLVRRVHTVVWAIPRTRIKYPWAVPVVVIAASIAAVAISSTGLLTDEWSTSLVTIELLGEVVLVTLGWLVLARMLPHHEDAESPRYLLPGAFVVGVGAIGMKAAIVLYFAPHAVSLSARYGDLAAAIVFVTWAYWISFIIVASAELNAAIFRSKRESQVWTRL